MSYYDRETVEIRCPCGRLLDTRNVTVAGGKVSGGIVRGTKTCPACKKTVEYAVSGLKAYTNYK